MSAGLRRGGSIPVLLPIYDPALARHPLGRVLRAWAEAGVRWFQYRDKTADDRRFWRAATRAHRLATELGLYPLINDRVHVAAALGGTGVHVGQSDLPVPPTRKLLGDTEWIGLSVESVDQASRGERDGADYVAVGPVFATGSKEDAGEAVGLEHVGRVAAAVSVPVVAIGGIGPRTVRSVIDAGADCVSVISAALDADDPGAAAGELIRAADPAGAGGEGAAVD